MKDPLRRTKVVVRHLPPSLPQSDLISQIDDRFSNRYNWFAFRPGKSSHKHQRYARVYIDFKTPEDVFEFADFFDKHVFVNEKGTQFKAFVEYAPSQRVSKPCTKKDGREGTIFKDPDYLEFLKQIAKPSENLPSAEVQLERKEAELSGAPKETPIVTPLMEFVRQKRAAESGTQGSATIAKVSRRAGAASTGKHGVSASKRSSEKKKYILKDSVKNTNRKDKSTFLVVPKREDQPTTSTGKEAAENETVCGIEGPVTRITLTSDSGKKKILLLKPKDREAPPVADGVSQQQGAMSPAAGSPVSTAPRQRREAGGRLIRSILLNNEASQSSAAIQPQQKIQSTSSDNVKRPSRPGNMRLGMNGHVSHDESSDIDMKRASDEKFIKKNLHGSGSLSEKHEKRARNKDRPDRGVWAPLRRSDVSQATEERSSPSMLQSTQLPPDSVEVTQGEMKGDMPYGSRGRNLPSMGNGSHRHFARRVGGHSMKDDGSAASEGKSSKRGVATGSGAHEKQVWVQKSSSGS